MCGIDWFWPSPLLWKTRLKEIQLMSDAERTPTGYQLWAGLKPNTSSADMRARWSRKKLILKKKKHVEFYVDALGIPKNILKGCWNTREILNPRQSCNLANSQQQIPKANLQRRWRSNEVPSGRYEDRRESHLLSIKVWIPAMEAVAIAGSSWHPSKNNSGFFTSFLKRCTYKITQAPGNSNKWVFSHSCDSCTIIHRWNKMKLTDGCPTQPGLNVR